jgi:membrane dipeptidase
VLVDLHAHYPMHVIPAERANTRAAVRARRPGGRWKAILVDLLSRLFNYQGPGDNPSVTVQLMHAGDVGAILSILYSPFDEMDLDLPYGAPPRAHYFQSVLDQIDAVEAHVAGEPLGATVAHDPAALEQAILAGRSAIVQCIEGGFALGARYGADVSAKISGGNALELLKRAWRGAPTATGT